MFVCRSIHTSYTELLDDLLLPVTPPLSRKDACSMVEGLTQAINEHPPFLPPSRSLPDVVERLRHVRSAR